MYIYIVTFHTDEFNAEIQKRIHLSMLSIYKNTGKWNPIEG